MHRYISSIALFFYALFKGVFMPNPDNIFDNLFNTIIIFITIYIQYAFKSYEVHPYDYLLKPVKQETLKSTIETASEKGIKFEVKDTVLPANISWLDPVDISTILGNALSNSIEACENVVNNTYINISFRYDESWLKITVSNTASAIPDKKKTGAGLISAKSESGHGIGIKSMAASAELYDGLIKYKYENGEFILEILLQRGLINVLFWKEKTAILLILTNIYLRNCDFMKKDFNARVGRNIRELRESLPLSIEEFAVLLDVSPGMMGLMERGQRGCSIKHFISLKERFGISIDTFVADESVKDVVDDNRIIQIVSLCDGFEEKEFDFIASQIRLYRQLKN